MLLKATSILKFFFGAATQPQKNREADMSTHLTLTFDGLLSFYFQCYPAAKRTAYLLRK